MTFKKVQWCAEYLAFRSFACVVEVLSPRQICRLSELLAWVMMNLVPRRVSRYELARKNLRCALGDEASEEEIHETIRRMWIHLFRLVGEVIQFPRKCRLENCREVMAFRNRAASVRALNSGRPVFLVGGHFGNWEASIVTFGVFGLQMGVVARKLDNPYLHAWFSKSREQTGHQLLLKNGGWDGMTELMQAGGNLGLLCDQDAGKRGIFVNFMGRPASTYRSLALMALEAKALIVVGYGRRVPDRFDEARWAQFEIGCEEVIDVNEIHAEDEIREITQRFSQALERAIFRAPEQYFWLHNRWKTAPREKKTPSLQKAG